MTTAIADIDMDRLVDLPLAPATTGLLALVRQHGRPVGLLRLVGHGPVMTTDRLRTALAALHPVSPADPVCPAPAPVSIVVCTHERPDDLARCLAALQPCTAAGHTVIVVDNAPRSERTAAVAARFACQYLREPRRGLDHARNCGLHAARTPLVAFTDDDAIADAGWVDAITTPFADPAVGCVTGLVMPWELETTAQEQFEQYCTHRRTFTRRTFTAPTTPPAAAGVVGMGANMALRRDLALQLGGFDPRLDAGTATCSGGDTDMFARVLESGAQIVYTPDALVWHRHRRDMPALRSCIFGYGIGLYAFLTKRLLEQRDLAALVIGARWWIGPIVKAVRRSLRGQAAVPTGLLAREAAGALLGPLMYWREAGRARAS